MDGADEGALDVDLLADDGSDEECEAPPSSGTLLFKVYLLYYILS